MVICSIDTLKKFLKKIATGIEKEIDASQQASDCGRQESERSE